jgi:HD-GYP domain-containing protein (c-di-GMP phosphodiesterase class II)
VSIQQELCTSPGGQIVKDTLTTHPHLMRAFDAALLFYDRHTAEHASRVSQASMRVGRALAFGEDELEALTWSGLLHDLGKLSIPEEMLRRPGPLTGDEWVQMRRHPTVGAELILSVSECLEPIAAGIRSHHERWDGTGYPSGLSGETIPLAGRIITVADVFDSMTSPRAYRSRKWSEAEVISHLETQRHLHFDPTVVSVFVELHGRA